MGNQQRVRRDGSRSRPGGGCPVTTTTHISCVESAKLVRASLRRHFPGVAFSVRSKVYSGGASVSVRWTDGPRTAAVEPVVGRFAGARFDGMDDSTAYVSEAQCDDAGNVSHVQYGSNYVFCQRQVSRSEELEALTVAMIRERCHCEATPSGKLLYGHEWIEDLARGVVRDMDFRDAAPMERAFGRVVMRRAE